MFTRGRHGIDWTPERRERAAVGQVRVNNQIKPLDAVNNDIPEGLSMEDANVLVGETLVLA